MSAPRKVLVTGATSGIGPASHAHWWPKARSCLPPAQPPPNGSGAFGELDAVVNCAGVLRRGSEHDPSVFADTVDGNPARYASAARHVPQALRDSGLGADCVDRFVRSRPAAQRAKRSRSLSFQNLPVEVRGIASSTS